MVHHHRHRHFRNSRCQAQKRRILRNCQRRVNDAKPNPQFQWLGYSFNNGKDAISKCSNDPKCMAIWKN